MLPFRAHSNGRLFLFWLERVTDPRAAKQLFWVVLAATLAFRIVFAARLPFTGDEAYFYFWGKHPQWGFYDHPPMVGWWLGALAQWSDQTLVLRLPTLLVPLVIAACVRLALSPAGVAAAWTGATLVLLAPLNAWNVAITTDIPLMLFSAFTVLAYVRAVRTGRWWDYLLAGLMLAGALMSKYFAGLLALGIAGHALWRPSRPKLVGLAWVVLGSLPAAVIQIAWNAQNCWPNVMFNLVNRHDNAGFSWRTPPLYLVSVVYVVIPAVAWYLFRSARAGRAPDNPFPATAPAASAVASSANDPSALPAAAAPVFAAEQQRALWWMAGLPLVLFGVLSLGKTIGLHWLASFVLPVLLLFLLRANRVVQSKVLMFSTTFVALHYVVITALSLVPIEKFSGSRSYPGIVMTLAPESMTQALERFRGRYVIAADGYSAAVTLGFNLGEYVLVFGPGSSHARHDDILTDFRKLAGRNILVVLKSPPDMASYRPYFDSVTATGMGLRGARFYLVLGQGFRYEPYRDAVLEGVRRQYYALPTWLPRGPCYFCDRYFPERACHR